MSAGLPTTPSLRGERRGCASERGSALVEFGIVLMVLLTLIWAIMEFSRFFYTYNFVSDAAREGTRYAAVRGATFGTTACSLNPTITYGCDASAANVTGYVQSLTPAGMSSASLTVTATWPGTPTSGYATLCNQTPGPTGLLNDPGCQVQVVVSYPYKFIFPFLPKGASAWTVSSTSEVAISQ